MLLIALVLAYLVGAIPTAVWLGKATHGIDVRAHGSGNMGATNVMRVLGWKAGVAVLLLDAFKGWLAAGPVASLGRQGIYGVVWPHTEAEVMMGIQLLCGVLAILGHSFPVFAGFKGGKGVATSAGVLLAITPGAFVFTVVAFLLVALTTRYIALASLAAAITYPATLFVLRFALGQPVPAFLLAGGTLMGAWLFWTHRGNIARLRAGTEKRLTFGQRVTGPDPS